MTEEIVHPLPPGDIKTALDKFAALLPVQIEELTPEEQIIVQRHQEARIVLGVAAAVIMTCAGEHCPIAETCPLQQMHKAPMGQPCPFEANDVVVKFTKWILELGKTEGTLTETERSSIAQLVSIDIQEHRCEQVLSIAKNAAMTDLSVKEIDLETGEALAYEKIIHANQQIIQELRTARRMLLDDMERSEKAKTRKLRIQQNTGKDLSSRQSADADKLRNVLEGEVVQPKQIPHA